MWATWDGTDGHRLVGTPSDDLASASKFSVYCQDGRCDAFVASHLADGAALSLCTYDGSAPPQNFPLLSLGTNTPSATAPLLLGNRAYFVDQAANNEWQLVRIVLEGNRER
jgi:hypothetical protein